MGKTMLELREQKRQEAGAKEYKGHEYFDLMRFDDDIRHMIVFDVLTWTAGAGDKGDRMRLYLSDKGYDKAKEDVEKGNIKILSHARVVAGHLHYDQKDQVR